MPSTTRFLRSAALAILCLAAMAGPATAQPASASGKPAAGTPAPAAAAPAAPDESSLALVEAAPGTSSASMLPYVLRMMLVLGLVIGVIYALYALLKRSARPRAQQDAYLRVLATTTLAPGRQLHVVSLGGSAWLVGSTDSSVGLIERIDDREVVDALELRATQSPEAPRREFVDMLSAWLGAAGRGPGTRGGAAGASPSDILSRQRDRLKKL